MAIDKVSPANGAARKSERTRVPMSAPQQKLAVPEIPGYYMYWMKGTPERLQKALGAGYEFVDYDEVQLTNVAIGGDATKNGNSDMGSRVSVISGEEVGPDNQPIRLYLMKIKEEWHQEDLAQQGQHSEKLIHALKNGQIGSEKDSGAGDNSARYAKAKISHVLRVRSSILALHKGVYTNFWRFTWLTSIDLRGFPRSGI